MERIVLAAFVVLQTLNGNETAVNVEQITSITKARDGEGNKLLSENVACVIGLANGSFLSVGMDCGEVLRLIAATEGPR